MSRMITTRVEGWLIPDEPLGKTLSLNFEINGVMIAGEGMRNL